MAKDWRIASDCITAESRGKKPIDMDKWSWSPWYVSGMMHNVRCNCAISGLTGYNSSKIALFQAIELLLYTIMYLYTNNIGCKSFRTTVLWWTGTKMKYLTNALVAVHRPILSESTVSDFEAYWQGFPYVGQSDPERFSDFEAFPGSRISICWTVGSAMIINDITSVMCLFITPTAPNIWFKYAMKVRGSH